MNEQKSRVLKKLKNSNSMVSEKFSNNFEFMGASNWFFSIGFIKHYFTDPFTEYLLCFMKAISI